MNHKNIDQKDKSELQKFTLFYEHVADTRPKNRNRQNKQPPRS